MILVGAISTYFVYLFCIHYEYVWLLLEILELLTGVLERVFKMCAMVTDAAGSTFELFKRLVV